MLLSHAVESVPQRLSVARHFLGSGRYPFGDVQIRLKQLVLRCDIAFHFRTCLGLLQCQGIDQNGLVGNAGGAALEFCQMAMGRDQCLEQFWRLKIDTQRRKLGDGVAGLQCHEVILFVSGFTQKTHVSAMMR